MNIACSLAARLGAIALSASSGGYALAQAVEPGVLTVTVENAYADADIYIALFDSKDDYDAGSAVRTQVVPVAAAGEVVFTVEGLEPGTYAFRMFQDRDGDKSFTMKLGVPQEPYGFSNGVIARFGPATFEQAAFEIAAGENAQSVYLY